MFRKFNTRAMPANEGGLHEVMGDLDYNEGNLAGALVFYQRAYVISPSPSLKAKIKETYETLKARE